MHGRSAYPGIAEGEAIISRDSIPGWGAAFDLATGAVNEPGNSLYGQSIRGRVLVLNGSRGSTGFATQFHKVRVCGVGPVALIIPRIDSRSAVACVVSRVPAVTDLKEDIFQLIQDGDWVRVDGDCGSVEIRQRIDRRSYNTALPSELACSLRDLLPARHWRRLHTAPLPGGPSPN